MFARINTASPQSAPVLTISTQESCRRRIRYDTSAERERMPPGLPSSRVPSRQFVDGLAAQIRRKGCLSIPNRGAVTEQPHRDQWEERPGIPDNGRRSACGSHEVAVAKIVDILEGDSASGWKALPGVEPYNNPVTRREFEVTRSVTVCHGQASSR